MALYWSVCRYIFRNKFSIIFLVFLTIALLHFYSSIVVHMCPVKCENTSSSNSYKYNSTYPRTLPMRTNTAITYRIAIVSDLDLQSRSNHENVWNSIFKKGWLTWLRRNNHISIHWDENETRLSSSYSLKNRGMELSELITFDGRLLAVDDRTGIVYNIDDDKIYPWVILTDGDGRNPKGFKSEWTAIKNQLLYVGSMGKEWTTPSGEFVNNHPMWVKEISPRGEVNSLKWIDNYKKLRSSINIEFPGYVIHESAVWSDVHNSWFFLPRRCSKNQYNETTDEIMSCNVLLKADEDFHTVTVTQIENMIAVRGFSSFKFLPDSGDSIIVALKTEEYKGETATYLTAFTINGEILISDIKIATQKFEGFEFI